MGFSEWLDRTITRVRTDGIEGLSKSSHELYKGLWRTFGWHVPRGTNIYEAEWDALIILDACRLDLLEAVVDDYEFLGSIERRTSVGSMSEEWMAKTFTDAYEPEIARTAHVTANVFSESELDDEAFLMLDEVWRDSWDDELGVVPPRPVTDRAITAGREHDPDRLIVHYMQPHHPFISPNHDLPTTVEADPFGRKNVQTAVDRLRQGAISYEAFWAAYEANLRYVLDDVGLLLDNLDAETVVITADHGDALGEWGIYDHPAGCLHPAVTDVPWAETTAIDTGEYEPTDRSTATDASVEDRLRQLGYVD